MTHRLTVICWRRAIPAFSITDPDGLAPGATVHVVPLPGQTLKAVAGAVAEDLSGRGLVVRVEDRGHTISWPCQDPLTAIVTLVPGTRASPPGEVVVGVQHAGTEDIVLRLTAHEREQAKVKASELVRNTHARARLSELSGRGRDLGYAIDPDGALRICADLTHYGLPFIAAQSLESIVEDWRSGAEQLRATETLMLFGWEIHAGRPDLAASLYQSFIDRESRPGARRVHEARLQHARDLGLIA